MTKRLTEKQKDEILKSFKSGIAIDVLSQKHSCTYSTITRNLKKNLGEFEYKELLKKSKSLKEKSKIYKKQNNDLKETNFDNEELKDNSNDPYIFNENIAVTNFAPIDSFFEIAPINYEMDNSSRKELSSVPLSEIDFPKVVYMIVDKKIELEIKLLKEYPDWRFLSQEDLNRKTIEIYYDLKSAKRNCTKDQRVIKVPNTNVFKIVAPLLISRGITRIISEDKLIAL